MVARQSVLVLGAGSWGTALALLLANRQHQVYLWDIDSDLIDDLIRDREHKRAIPSVAFPAGLHPVKSVQEAPADIRIVINAVPCCGLRSSLRLIKYFTDLKLCLAGKGLESGTQKLNHQIVGEELGCPVAVLSGPSFAKEVAANLPTAVIIASNQKSLTEMFSSLFHGDMFRVYTHDDLIGVQIGGAVKNVMAIATGIADGLGYGVNARAALITRGLAEIMRLGLAMGARRETFTGLSGMGDLVLTCTDNQSRNRSFGLLLGQGLPLTEAERRVGQVIEGVKTAFEVDCLATRYGVDMPITTQLVDVLKGAVDPDQAVRKLLERPPRPESGGG